jgi:predicted TIM-barrel fold metal-dependent hydrolase
MKKPILILMLALMTTAWSQQQTPKLVEGPFSDRELAQFIALGPIDTHTHVFQDDPTFYVMLRRLNLHIVNILFDDDSGEQKQSLSEERRAAWNVVHKSGGYAVLCTTFNPFEFNQPNFARHAMDEIEQDFSKGAVAVKIWKNVGMEIKDRDGNYVMPDNPEFAPIFRDIATRNKTLIAHLADPDTIWQPPSPLAPDYNYYMKHQKLYMYGKPGAPSKAEILYARDKVVRENPNLRVVGAHLGSMEADFARLSRVLDQNPNFAIDLAARMDYVEKQPRAEIIAFITKYQDRLVYGTDNESFPGDAVQDVPRRWESVYANDWRFFATTDTIRYKGRQASGLALPEAILRKIYHDNAVKWFPGVLGEKGAQ